MSIFFHILGLLTVGIFFVGQSSSQKYEYSQYKCYDDWMLKFEDFSTVTAENGSMFTDHRALEWVNRCIGYEKRDANDKDQVLGRTALHYVSRYNGAIPVMEYLLSNGADIEAKDKLGVRPLSATIYLSFWTPESYLAHITQHVEFLLQNGADPNGQDSFGFSPLHHATARSYTGIMRLLIDYDANINIANNGKVTPIHFATASGDPLATKILIDSGANVNIQTKSKLKYTDINFHHVMEPKTNNENKNKTDPVTIPGKQSPLHLAAATESHWWPLYVDIDGKPTPIGIKLMNHHKDTCQLLVNSGGNVFLRNEEGQTAYETAYIAGHERPVEEWERVLSSSNRECADIFSPKRVR